jgi:NAD(P)H-dependent FMN reductase
MRMEISIVYGSVRSLRKGIVAARYLEKSLRERDAVIHFIDALEYKLPLLDKMYKEYEEGAAPGRMEELAGIFEKSDGFIFVTGEYNHSVPPALKNLLDHFQREYYFKPAAIASYSGGPFGGVRAAVHLRSILGELGMASISTILPFPKVGSLFSDELIPKNDIVGKSTKQFFDEFFWYAEALKKQREKGMPF